MPTINMLLSDLESLVGKSLPRSSEDLTELLAFVKGEVETLVGEELAVEIKDGNRADLWGVEGIARALRGALGIEEGLKQYRAEAFSGVEVRVDAKLRGIRPYIGAAVLRGMHLTDDIIRGFMNLQDKLDQTYGRKRTRTSIGLYDFNLITPPLRYTVAKPEAVSFIPLNGSRKMNLREILSAHPKGLEYGHIVEPFEEWPILLDAEENILSFPPIINSNDLGRITEDTQDILVEVTGTDHNTVLNTLTLVTLSVADRSGQIMSSRISYPYGEAREEIVPNLAASEARLELRLVGDVLGLSLNPEEVIGYLRRARYDANLIDGKFALVKVPCYRVDVMHPVDIVEDVAMMYGYNKIEPRWPQLVTFGELDEAELAYDSVREVMVGLGFQEILSFSMTNPQNLFDRMNVKRERIVEVANPLTERFTCLRSWLLPSLMEFLSSNTHVSYPQEIFEVGECAVLDGSSRTGISDVEKLACVSIHSKAAFSEIKAALDAFFLNLGLKYDLAETRHGSFIEGRAGEISVQGVDIGLIGEINPSVLEQWGLENPAVGFEVDLSKLLNNMIK